MATGDGGDHLGARVGRGARGQVFAQQECDLSLQHAITEARAREQRAAGDHPGQRHGREEGRGIGRARADLPSADGAEGRDDNAVDEGSLLQRLRLQFGRQVGDRVVVAAGVEQQIGGFEELLHAGFGHSGTSVAQTGGCVMRCSTEAGESLAPPFPPPRPHKAAHAEVAEDTPASPARPPVADVRPRWTPLPAQTPHPIAANSTKSPKTTPTTSSHSTPHRRVNVFHAVAKAPAAAPQPLLRSTRLDDGLGRGMGRSCCFALVAGAVVGAGPPRCAWAAPPPDRYSPPFASPALLARGSPPWPRPPQPSPSSPPAAPRSQAHVQSEPHPFSKCRAISRFL